GDRPAAIEQMLAVARMYLDRGSLSAAEAELYQVLELSPELPTALQLLEQVEGKTRLSRAPKPRKAGAKQPSVPGLEELPSAPSSQVEHEAFELRTRVSSPALPAAGTAPPPAQRAPQAAGTPEGPLPAYDLEDEQTGRTAALAKPETPLPQFSLDSGLLAAPEAAGSASARPPPSRRESIRAALDEAEFFSSRGLYQDASMILRDR